MWSLGTYVLAHAVVSTMLEGLVYVRAYNGGSYVRTYMCCSANRLHGQRSTMLEGLVERMEAPNVSGEAQSGPTPCYLAHLGPKHNHDACCTYAEVISASGGRPKLGPPLVAPMGHISKPAYAG